MQRVHIERLEPRLPHERDESTDSQRSDEPDPQMQRAADDLASGREDTDRGPVMDETYDRLKRRP